MIYNLRDKYDNGRFKTKVESLLKRIQVDQEPIIVDFKEKSTVN